jgi:hypothetical protein
MARQNRFMSDAHPSPGGIRQSEHSGGHQLATVPTVRLEQAIIDAKDELLVLITAYLLEKSQFHVQLDIVWTFHLRMMSPL